MDVMKPHIKSEVLISPDDMKEEITVEPLITFLPEHEVHSPKVEGCSYVKPACTGGQYEKQYENTESTVVYIKDEHDEEQVSDTCNEILAEEWNENECETILGMEEDENIRNIFLKDKIGKDEDKIDDASTKPVSIILQQQQTNEISVVEESLQNPIEENSEIDENEPADAKGSTVSENVEVVYDLDDCEVSSPSEEDCTNIEDYGNESANTEEKIDCNPSIVVGPDYGYYIQLPQNISENGIVETNIDGSANTENSEVYAVSDDDSESPSRIENEEVRPVVDTGGSILRAALLKGSKHINYTKKSQVNILNTKESETPNNYKCSLCGKSFKKAVSVQIHYSLKHFKQQDTDSNSFTCSICDKNFTSRVKFLKHSRTHNLLYKCIICDKQFSERFRLTNHLKTHADESPASCPVCGKYFKKKKFLDDHMLFHGVGREFACSICKKSFSKLSRLKQHSAVHDGILSVVDV